MSEAISGIPACRFAHAYPLHDGPTTAKVTMSGGTTVGYPMLGANEHVRIVTPKQFENIRIQLMGGARRVEPHTVYNGVWYLRQDGTVFGLRISREHGLTLDVIESDHPLIPPGLRIHQR